MDKNRDGFVSGLSDPSEQPKKRTVRDIVDSAIRGKRVRQSFRQGYQSRGTVHTARATARMLGTPDDAA